MKKPISSVIVLNIDGEPAIRINGKILKDSELRQTCLCDCEGNTTWLVKRHIKPNKHDSTINIKEWYYNYLVKEGRL